MKWRDNHTIGYLFFFRQVGEISRRRTEWSEKMIKKITKDIQKLEQLKEKKNLQKDEIEKELADISSKLKTLYSFKSQYEKMENSVEDFFNSAIEE